MTQLNFNLFFFMRLNIPIVLVELLSIIYNFIRAKKQYFNSIIQLLFLKNTTNILDDEA